MARPSRQIATLRIVERVAPSRGLVLGEMRTCPINYATSANDPKQTFVSQPLSIVPKNVCC